MIKLLKEIQVVTKFDLETGVTTVMCAFDDKKDGNIYIANQRHKKCNLGCTFKMVPIELKSQAPEVIRSFDDQGNLNMKVEVTK